MTPLVVDIDDGRNGRWLSANQQQFSSSGPYTSDTGDISGANCVNYTTCNSGKTRTYNTDRGGAELGATDQADGEPSEMGRHRSKPVRSRYQSYPV